MTRGGRAVDHASDSSRPVTSNQAGPHPRLSALVARHAQATRQAPLPAHAAQAVARVRDALAARPRPLLVDAGCGTAEAAIALAERHSNALVVGVDKSAARLARARLPAGGLPNLLLLRTDLPGFWRELRAADIHPQTHYLLYPNPWPKQHQLARRWHAHPVMPTLLALGGTLELRSNWRIYLEEFALAVHQLTGLAATVEDFTPARAETAFERKYAYAGQHLYRLRVALPACGLGPVDLSLFNAVAP